MKRQWTEAELNTHWALTAQEEALLVGRSGHGRFSFVVLLKFFQYEGRFPESRREIPADVMCYLATQLGMSLNTLMIQRVLDEPHWWNLIKSEDFRALSPLIYAHINPYGVFDLDMSTRLPIEEIRMAA